MRFSEKVLNKVVNRKTMLVCSVLGVVSIPYWVGYFAGTIQADTIHAVFEIMEHKED